MREHKSHCLLVLRDVESAMSVYNTLNGQFSQFISNGERRIYCAYAQNVQTANVCDSFHSTWPPGLHVIEDFITADEEENLVDCFNACNINEEEQLKQRRVKHFGYAWNYKMNTIDKHSPLPEPIPAVCRGVLSRAVERGIITTTPDQCTVNYYTPGEGIPPHVDTHSACGDTILSLSCSSDIVMTFTHSHPHHKLNVVLPRRSLLTMSGEARYDWLHSIPARKSDAIPSTDGTGLTLVKRKPRLSFTFRSVLYTPCACAYPRLCDSHS